MMSVETSIVSQSKVIEMPTAEAEVALQAA